MDLKMLTAFVNELQKIASVANVTAPSAISKGSNIVTQSPFAKPGISKPTSNPTAKPTNYSIVNTQAPVAANVAAPPAMSAAPPPPVRT